MSVSGLIASGSAIQPFSVGRVVLGADVRQLRSVRAAIAVDDMAADAVARPHAGRGLDLRRVARVRLARHLLDVGDQRRSLALGDGGRAARAGRARSSPRQRRARSATPDRATSRPARAGRPCRSPSGSARISHLPRTAARRSRASTRCPRLPPRPVCRANPAWSGPLPRPRPQERRPSPRAAGGGRAPVRDRATAAARAAPPARSG